MKFFAKNIHKHRNNEEIQNFGRNMLRRTLTSKFTYHAFHHKDGQYGSYPRN